MAEMIGLACIVLGIIVLVGGHVHDGAEREVLTVLTGTRQWKTGVQIHQQIWTNRITKALETSRPQSGTDLFVEYKHLEPNAIIVGKALQTLERRAQIESRGETIDEREWRKVRGYDHRKGSKRPWALPAFDWTFGRPTPVAA